MLCYYPDRVQFVKLSLCGSKTLVNRMNLYPAQFNDLVQLFIYLCNQSVIVVRKIRQKWARFFHGD